jgi:MFS family permease
MPLLTMLRERTFLSLRHPDYRWYFFGQLISFTGSWMQSSAMMWFVYILTGDPLWPPLMLIAATGPSLLLGPLGGSLIDRYPKRKIVILLQSIFLIQSSILALLAGFNLATPPLLFGLACLSGCVLAFDLPARLAFVPDLVPKADLINAVALNSMLFNSARAIGPALAAGLFLIVLSITTALGIQDELRTTRIGCASCFACNALSYVAVLVALFKINARGTQPSRKLKHSAWDGFRYVWQERRFAVLLLCTSIVSIFGWPTLTLFPPYTKLVLGLAEKQYSLLVSAMGVGALLAALLNATYATPARQGWFLILGTGLTALAVLALSTVTTLWLALLCSAAFGMGMVLYLSTGQSLLQQNVPDHLRGRVMALWPMALSGAAVVGHFVAGNLARTLPLPRVLQGMCIGLCAGVALALYLARCWAVAPLQKTTELAQVETMHQLGSEAAHR